MGHEAGCVRTMGKGIVLATEVMIPRGAGHEKKTAGAGERRSWTIQVVPQVVD